MSIVWINYRGKQIIHTDYTGSKNEQELLSILYHAATVFHNQPTRVLALTSYDYRFAHDVFLQEMKRLAKEVFDQKSERNAILGMTGLKKIMHQVRSALAGHQASKLFKTEAEAMAWLVE